jgi:flagellar biosynthesis protein FlhG
MRRIWTMGGGKGGAGRSLLLANLGIALARAGRKVLLIDLAPEGPGLHACLGFARVPHPPASVSTGAPSLAGLAVDTPIHHLRLLAHGRIRQADGSLPADLPGRLAATTEADAILIDCGSGRSEAVLDAFHLGDLGIVATSPEPPALESACAFGAAHLRRCLERALPGDVRRALDELLASEGIDPARLSFRTLMQRLGALDSAARDRVAETVSRVRLELIVTQVRDETDEEAAAALASAFLKAFGVSLPIAGLVPCDPSVLQAVSKRRPLAQQFPNTPATKAIARAAERLLHAAGAGAVTGPEWDDLGGLHHYRVLEVVPKASSKEIQAAYQILKRAFGLETTPLLPLLDDGDLRALHARVEDAYRHLIFLETRVTYDRSLVEGGILKPDEVRGLHDESGELPAGPHEWMMSPPGAGNQEAPDNAPSETTPSPAAAPGTAPDPEAGVPTPAVPGLESPAAPAAPRVIPMTGEALRAERERMGQSLESISSRTKIRPSFLAALEEERWDRLPSPVFLRGFLREYAACLGLPADEVARALLLRRDRALLPPLATPQSRTA